MTVGTLPNMTASDLGSDAMCSFIPDVESAICGTAVDSE